MDRSRLFPAAVVVLLLVAFSGCDKGLAPPEKENTPLTGPSGFRGVISFKNWPAPSSVQELRLVAFLNAPTDSTNIFLALLSGKVVVYPPIGSPGFPKNVDTLSYVVVTPETTAQVVNYAYVALAQRYGPNPLTDWRPAGVYTIQPGTFTPAALQVQQHRITPNVDIQVDFNNPPPKPWQ